MEDLLEHAEEAAATLPEDSLWLRLVTAALFQAAYRFTGREDMGRRARALARGVADRVDVPHMAIAARGVLASIHLLSGRFHAVFERAGAGIELAAAMGLARDAGVAPCHQFRGYVLFEWNRLEEAREELERAWDLTSSDGVRSGVARILTAAFTAAGESEAADSWFERLQRIVSEPMTLRNREWLAAVRIRHGAGESRDLRAIDAWRQSYRYHSGALGSRPERIISARLQEYEHLLALMEATRQWDAVEAVAEDMLRGAGRERRWFIARALVARAVALEGRGRRDEADAAMTEALEAGRDGSFVRVYLDGSPLRLRLLRRASESASTENVARAILSTLPEGETGHGGPNLTPRQLDVLREVATGLSNRDVAGELEEAETTIKTHLREICRRLNVGSRTAAVAKGRRLRLL